MNQPTVLAITKRTADLCGTQSVLYGAGFDLVTATSVTGAKSVIKAIPVSGVIICRHSWSDDERETMVSELAARHPDAAVVVRCPGCAECDEARHVPGKLSDTLWLTELMTAIHATAD